MKSLAAGLTDEQNLTGTGLGFRTVKEFWIADWNFPIYIKMDSKDGMQHLGHRV